LLTHGRWFSPGIRASSTTKTGRHDIAEILLKVALKHKKSINQSNISQPGPLYIKKETVGFKKQYKSTIDHHLYGFTNSTCESFNV
jgi:hypothetical protein